MDYREAILAELRELYADRGPGNFFLADSLKAFRPGDGHYLLALNQLLSEGLILGTSGPDARVAIAINPEKIAAMPPIVQSNVTINLGPGASFSGPLAIGQTIAQTFSSATSTQDEHLRNTLQELVVLVGKVIEKLPAEKKSEVTEDLSVFVEQAKKKERSDKALKITGEGLVEAAKAVANLAEPVVDSVRTILHLLGN